MNDISRNYAKPRVRDASQLDRRAEVLLELRQQNADLATLEQQVKQQSLDIARLLEHNKLLTEQLRTSQEYERVAMRKLMRLAAHVQSINLISAEANAIVRDVKDWEDQLQEQETVSVAEEITYQPEPATEQDNSTDDVDGAEQIVNQLSKLSPAWLDRR